MMSCENDAVNPSFFTRQLLLNGPVTMVSGVGDRKGCNQMLVMHCQWYHHKQNNHHGYSQIQTFFVTFDFRFDLKL